MKKINKYINIYILILIINAISMPSLVGMEEQPQGTLIFNWVHDFRDGKNPELIAKRTLLDLSGPLSAGMTLHEVVEEYGLNFLFDQEYDELRQAFIRVIEENPNYNANPDMLMLRDYLK